VESTDFFYRIAGGPGYRRERGEERRAREKVVGRSEARPGEEEQSRIG